MPPVLGYALALVALVSIAAGVYNLCEGIAKRSAARIVAAACIIAFAVVGVGMLVWHGQADGTVCVGARSACQEVVR